MANPVIDLINQERAKVGAKPLVQDEKLDNAAQRQATFMGNSDSQTTSNPDGSTSETRAKDSGFTGNVQEATGISPIGSSPQVAFDNLFANSREIILNPEATEIGVGQGNDTDEATPETFTSVVVGSTQIMEPDKNTDPKMAQNMGQIEPINNADPKMAQIMEPDKNSDPNMGQNMETDKKPDPSGNMIATNQFSMQNKNNEQLFQQNFKEINRDDTPVVNQNNSDTGKDSLTGSFPSVGDPQNFQSKDNGMIASQNSTNMFGVCIASSNTFPVDGENNKGIISSQFNSTNPDIMGAPQNPMGSSDMMSTANNVLAMD